MIVEYIVEQCIGDFFRNKYDPFSNNFIQTIDEFLYTKRGFIGLSGWIKGYGTPPDPHLDIIILTRRNSILGSTSKAKTVGVFQRDDGDNKFIGIECFRIEHNFSELPIDEQEMLKNIFKIKHKNEGFFQ